MWSSPEKYEREVEDVNARLAKILTVDDYDFKKKSVRLWSHSSDYQIDNGTGSEDESNER